MNNRYYFIKLLKVGGIDASVNEVCSKLKSWNMLGIWLLLDVFGVLGPRKKLRE